MRNTYYALPPCIHIFSYIIYYFFELFHMAWVIKHKEVILDDILVIYEWHTLGIKKKYCSEMAVDCGCRPGNEDY